MNENSSTNSPSSAPHHGLTAEMISRRAYEIWEQEGRPEGQDLHHWLRAEQSLLAERGQGGAQPQEQAAASRGVGADTASAGRPSAPPARNGGKKSGSAAPFSAEKPVGARSGPPGSRSTPSRV